MKSFKQYLREATWTDYYDKIVDLDLDTKTMSSKYKNRKDLESAAAKKYGWNVKSEPFKTAFDKYFNESVKLTEAKATHLTSIEMESTNSRLDWNFTSQGLTLGTMSGRPVSYYGDNEYRKFYDNSEQQDWTNWLKTSGQGIMKDLEKVADEFDKKIAQVLAKHGFKK